MLSFTIEQWAIVALVFVAGWLLGLASHGGGKKWRARYAAARAAHAPPRQAAAAPRVAAETRTAELQREHDRLRSAAPVTAPAVAPTTPVRPSVASAARPAYAPGERRGWFELGPQRP